MIGVVVQESRQAVAMEFFELFKTPWEFARSGRKYDVLLCAGNVIPAYPARLVLCYSSAALNEDPDWKVRIAHAQPGMVVQCTEGAIPLNGPGVTFQGDALWNLVDQSHGEPFATAVKAPGQDFIRLGFDLFDEVSRLLTEGQPAARAGTPTLDRHIALLRELITRAGIPLVEIPPIPSGHKFAVCLTHDVDHPIFRNHRFDPTMFGFFFRSTLGSLFEMVRGRTSVRTLVRNWAAALQAPLVHLNLLPDPWRHALSEYGQMEKGLSSTFFVIPFARRPGVNQRGAVVDRRGAGYDLAEIAPELRELQAGGAEIGLHGIDSWRDCEAGRDECERVRSLAGRREVGVRMHWLYFDPQKSPAILEQAGVAYDSTVGYNDTVGFRAGTSQVFKHPGASSLLELPLHIMDTALFYYSYLGLDSTSAREVVRPLVQHVVRAGGVLTTNWHDRSLAPERLWGEFYLWLLDEFKRQGAWFATAGEAVAWFRKRRGVSFLEVTWAGNQLRVRTSIVEAGPGPALRLRVHRPLTAGSAASDEAPSFVEVPLTSGETAIAV
jgi:hypothetical protein